MLDLEDIPDGVNEDYLPWLVAASWLWPMPGQRAVSRYPWRELEDVAGSRLFIEAIKVACRILMVFRLAYHAGAAIRWFEYDSKNARGGILGFLVPVNAREVCKVQRPGTALDYLTLTTANKESLVFHAPPTDEDPGVLFTADSDLKFAAPIAWNDEMVITVPHHGSEDNQHAYRRFHQDSHSQNLNVVWVRSNGRFKNRPGWSFLSEKGRRYCTLCRGTNGKQPVNLVASGGTWQPVNTRACACV